MIHPGVFLQTHFSSSHKLVADMLECFSPSRFTLFVCLELAGFRVEKPAHLRQQLLLVYPGHLLLLMLLLALPANASLGPPVSPHVPQLVCGEESLAILPI